MSTRIDERLASSARAVLVLALLVSAPRAAADSGVSPDGVNCVVKPEPLSRALRNPLKGFTTRGVRASHPWATLAHHYIRWNEIENDASDGIEKIRAFCDAQWKGLPEKNVKVIPRVYLHWSGDRKYWPADLRADDYTSARFRERVLRLVERLGRLWDGDSRVAYVELGIFGKWGEHHSPSPTPEMQNLVGDGFARAFKHKLVSVRHAWSEFTGHPFGEYWDSFAHYQQMAAHGKPIADLNARTRRWRAAYIGGETAYDWGLSTTQPGPTPTDSLAEPEHRDFVISTIRWLHCTQLRWIADYDRANPAAREGAEAMQKAFGYRFLLEEVEFTRWVLGSEPLRVRFTVKNVGSAPFYYDWPIEVALLRQKDLEVVWKRVFANADIRDWLPGDGWTEPEWVPISQWPKRAPRPGWSDATPRWRTPPKSYTTRGEFAVRAAPGTYILALSVLDPAGNVPSLRFATKNYLTGGRHPVGIVAIGAKGGGALPADFAFDDPVDDSTLRYDGSATRTSSVPK